MTTIASDLDDISRARAVLSVARSQRTSALRYADDIDLRADLTEALAALLDHIDRADLVGAMAAQVAATSVFSRFEGKLDAIALMIREIDLPHGSCVCPCSNCSGCLA